MLCRRCRRQRMRRYPREHSDHAMLWSPRAPTLRMPRKTRDRGAWPTLSSLLLDCTMYIRVRHGSTHAYGMYVQVDWARHGALRHDTRQHDTRLEIRTYTYTCMSDGSE